VALASPELSWRLRQVRARAATVGWRQAMDDLRPLVQRAWREMDIVRRRRFLRHLRPWWDVHRHRMAPAAADRIAAIQAEGRLTVAAGRISTAEAAGGGVRLGWRRRGASAQAFVEADHVINCSGLGGDIAGTQEPILRDLLAAGAARPDGLGLGLDVDDSFHVVDPLGQPSARLYAVGPPTRGALWEIVAVPDIRDQVAEVAARIARDLDA